jgi:hypothetical protein
LGSGGRKITNLRRPLSQKNQLTNKTKAVTDLQCCQFSLFPKFNITLDALFGSFLLLLFYGIGA